MSSAWTKGIMRSQSAASGWILQPRNLNCSPRWLSIGAELSQERLFCRMFGVIRLQLILARLIRMLDGSAKSWVQRPIELSRCEARATDFSLINTLCDNWVFDCFTGFVRHS